MKQEGPTNLHVQFSQELLSWLLPLAWLSNLLSVVWEQMFPGGFRGDYHRSGSDPPQCYSLSLWLCRPTDVFCTTVPVLLPLEWELGISSRQTLSGQVAAELNMRRPANHCMELLPTEKSDRVVTEKPEVVSLRVDPPCYVKHPLPASKHCFPWAASIVLAARAAWIKLSPSGLCNSEDLTVMNHSAFQEGNIPPVSGRQNFQVIFLRTSGRDPTTPDSLVTLESAFVVAARARLAGQCQRQKSS